MTQESTAELERDAERVRAQVADTAEQLKGKMSPGQLMDEVVSYFRAGGQSSQILGNLKDQVRDNPLALALVGGGLAWLMMGSGSSASTTALPTPNPLSGNRSTSRSMGGSNTYGGASPSSGAGLGTAAADLRAKASDMAGSVADSANRALHDVRDSVAESWDHSSDVATATTNRAKASILGALEHEPLVFGALGVAVGAAIGAMLPSTEIERDYVGKASSNVRDSAEELIAGGIDKVREVASDVYSAVRDEADNQGLLPHGKPLAEKFSEVAKVAGAEIKAAAVSVLDSVETEAESAVDRWSADKDRS